MARADWVEALVCMLVPRLNLVATNFTNVGGDAPAPRMECACKSFLDARLLGWDHASEDPMSSPLLEPRPQHDLEGPGGTMLSMELQVDVGNPIRIRQVVVDRRACQPVGP